MGASRPLDGKRIVVTRPRHQSANLVKLFRDAGAEVIELPLIEIAEPSSWEPADAAARRVKEGRYDWVAFTSANAVRGFVPRLHDDVRARVAAVGDKTRSELECHGLTVDLVPPEANALALVDALGSGTGNVLLPRVEGGPRTIVEALEANGWRVDEVAVYRNVRAPLDPAVAEQVRRGDYDVVTFASGSAVRRFVDEFDTARVGLVACIGPVTAGVARDLGLEARVVAGAASDEDLASVLIERLVQVL